MNRKELEALGLTEEQIESVMKAHGKVVNDTKGVVDKLTIERDNLKKDLKDRDDQLVELKKIDHEALQQEITRLEGVNESQKAESQKLLDAQTFSFELEKALNKAKAKNPKAVKALLDVESLKLDGDKILGLDTQLTKLQESESYLFEEEEEEDPGNLHGRSPHKKNTKKGSPTVNPFAKETFNLTEQAKLFVEDPEQYKLLKAQA